MAMYPNATYGYMPFVKPAHKRQAAKKSKVDKTDSVKSNKTGDMKTYKVTLRDRNGFTYTYIIQADTTSKSAPVLCESRVAAPKNLSSSLPNMKSPSMSSPDSRRHSSCIGLAQGKEDLTKVDSGEKKGLFKSIINFIKNRTTNKSSKAKPQPQASLKSKRKPRPTFAKKRQRTISAMSNLDPIQESPEEDEEDDDDDFDTDSYSHDSGSEGSVSES